MSTSAQVYGEQVPESDVSYEGYGMVKGQLTQPYYYRISDKTRVVFVNPSNEESVNGEKGFFAVYTGAQADYTPVVVG